MDGIKWKLAARICAYRPFDSWDDAAETPYIRIVRLKTQQRTFTVKPFDYCIGVSNTSSDATFVLLDGGSDGHCARPWFGGNKPLTQSTIRLRDAVKRQIDLDGVKQVHFNILSEEIEVVTATSNFQIGPFAKDLFSTVKLFDGGMDVIMLQKHGCFIGRGDLVW